MRKYTEADFQDMVDFFDQMAQTPWLRGIHIELVERLTQQYQELIAAQKLRALDAGCGTGRLLQLLAKHTAFAVGMDFSKDMINRAQTLITNELEYPQLGFIHGDVEAIPLANNSFHLCIATCLIFLLPEPKHALAEINRILMPDGSIAMLNPSIELTEASAKAYIAKHGLSDEEAMFLLKWTNVAERKRRISQEEWEQLLLTTGFRNIVHHPVLKGLGLITMAKK